MLVFNDRDILMSLLEDAEVFQGEVFVPELLEGVSLAHIAALLQDKVSAENLIAKTAVPRFLKLFSLCEQEMTKVKREGSQEYHKFFRNVSTGGFEAGYAGLNLLRSFHQEFLEVVCTDVEEYNDYHSHAYNNQPGLDIVTPGAVWVEREVTQDQSEKIHEYIQPLVRHTLSIFFLRPQKESRGSRTKLILESIDLIMNSLMKANELGVNMPPQFNFEDNVTEYDNGQILGDVKHILDFYLDFAKRIDALPEPEKND